MAQAQRLGSLQQVARQIKICYSAYVILLEVINKMYLHFRSNTTSIIYNIIKYHISDMFRVVYKSIFRLQLTLHFDIQLEIYLKYEISFTFEYEIQKYEI